MKYRVLKYFKLGDYMSKPYREGDTMDLQPNVAEALMDQGKVERIVDEPPRIETAAMQTSTDTEMHREIKAKRKTKRQTA